MSALVQVLMTWVATADGTSVCGDPQKKVGSMSFPPLISAAPATAVWRGVVA
ncbi:hypothetical protein G6L46_31055 [Agrobacterium rhizogenes]|uniref:hypothetical protein n=1 Tax=Rhizobium rhizogenes TaxID=359 RepID=UPI0015745FA0|nr:hypothetical protein [Rhizobium rhizogenes]NTF91608.1 hypothetical protein [Rhizobium rhizogenes]